MSTLERAIEIAEKAHAGQYDKGGAPYIRHPLRLMKRLFSEEEKIAAVLHDVVEDGEVTLAELRAEGFSDEVVEAVDSLTRRPDEPYDLFILRAASNDLARRVKLADLFDNCDLSRIPDPGPADFERLKKYQGAIRAIRILFEGFEKKSSGRERFQLPESTDILAEAKFYCAVCGKEAGHILILQTPRGTELLRRSFTSAMTQKGVIPETLYTAIMGQNAKELYALDFELAPFYCPKCDACYCKDHWVRWDEFDESFPLFHDSIQGRCPKGHIRMLED